MTARNARNFPIMHDYKIANGKFQISRIRKSNSFEARLSQGCVGADTDRRGGEEGGGGAFLQNLDYAGAKAGEFLDPLPKG